MMISTDQAPVGRHSALIKMAGNGIIVAILPFLLVIAQNDANAQSDGRSGKQVVEATCIACHGSGANGAPKIGDKQAWSKRASQGLTSLSQNALMGVRQMPPHGGNSSLSDLEIQRAITYMVNQSGGNWTEALDTASPRAERSGEQIVRVQCAKCHETGVGGAPRIGDKTAWIPRVQQGFDALVRSGINGHGGMPPRGGEADLTDPEIRNAVVYMFNGGAVVAKAPPVAKVVTGQGFSLVDSTTIYFGVVSAAVIRDHPKDYPESVYGSEPLGPGQYYLTVNLFDANSGQRITDALVMARVLTAAGASPEKKLEPVIVAKSQSYGSYFAMAGASSYTITLHIRRPGVANEIQAKFDFTPQ